MDNNRSSAIIAKLQKICPGGVAVAVALHLLTLIGPEDNQSFSSANSNASTASANEC